MFRIDAPGFAPGNLFTDGDPQTSTAATTVSDEWLNEVQQELITPVEALGIALVKGSQNQLNAAILEYFLRGGSVSPLIVALPNDTGPSPVTGFLMNKSTSVCKVGLYNIERKTDTGVLNEVGLVMCSYNSKDDVWIASGFSVLDGDTEFTVDNADTDAAQLEFTTGDLPGASYVGNITISSIIELRNS